MTFVDQIFFRFVELRERFQEDQFFKQRYQHHNTMYLYALTVFLFATNSYLIEGVPYAVDDSYSIEPDTPVCLNVLSNDNGASIQVVGFQATTNGQPYLDYPSFFYQKPNSMLVMDAENAQVVNIRTGSFYSNDSDTVVWEFTSNYSGSAGTGAMALTPSGVDLPITTYGPALEFRVVFTEFMDYQVWIRGQSCMNCSFNSSVHFFTEDPISGELNFTTNGDPATGFSMGYSWIQIPVIINISSAETQYPPHVKKLYVAMKNSGFVFDKIILRNAKSNGSNFSQMTTGPQESPIFNCPNGLMYFPKPGFAGIDVLTYTVSDGVDSSSARVTVTVGTPPSPACSLDTPFRCSDSDLCVSDPADCSTAVTCPDSTPFACFNNTCVVSPQSCSASCSCWNGNCNTNSTCPPVPSCPDSKPKRCWNGCFTTDTTCEATPSCSIELTCPDGSCVSDPADCHPYNGCPLASPIQCADGSCALEESDCLCKNGLERCIDGSCQVTCEKPLFLIKPIEMTVSFFTEDNTTVEFSNEEEELLGFLEIPENSLTTISGSFLASLTIVPITDSDIRKDSVIPLSSVISLTTLDVLLPFNQPVLLNLNIQLPVDKELSDLCLAELTDMGWSCLNTTLEVTSNPLLFAARIWKTATMSVVATTSSDKDSSKEGIVHIGAIVGASVSGAIVVGGFIASVVFYRYKRARRQRRMTQVKRMIETGIPTVTIAMYN